MIEVWLVMLLVLSNRLCSTGVNMNGSTIPDTVNIGAIFSFNSTTGKTIKIALEAALEDVNSDPSVLNKTKLVISMQEDSIFKGFLSIAESKSFAINLSVKKFSFLL